MQIVKLCDYPQFKSEIIAIFFESSPKKKFESDKAKLDFQYKYLDYYMEMYPDLFLIGIKENQALGYICGSPQSSEDDKLYDLLSHYKLFEAYFDSFPAHLHINLHASSRGMGLGSKLILEFENRIEKGVHLLTSPDAMNRKFYKKNGYSTEIIKDFRGNPILLMGKTKG